MNDVRPATLLCTTCMEWKPDKAFYYGRHKRRRNRGSKCRECLRGLYRNGERTFEGLWARLADRQGRSPAG